MYLKILKITTTSFLTEFLKTKLTLNHPRPLHMCMIIYNNLNESLPGEISRTGELVDLYTLLPLTNSTVLLPSERRELKRILTRD